MSNTIDTCQTGYDYEQFQLNELENENMKLKKKLEIATKALIDYANSDEWELVDSKNVYWSRKRFPYPWRIAGKALKEMEGVK